MANRYYFSDGNTVEVYSHNVTMNNGGPSGVDYYYDTERGYGCRNEREVAQQYHRNFAPLSGNPIIKKVVPIDDFGEEIAIA